MNLKNTFRALLFALPISGAIATSAWLAQHRTVLVAQLAQEQAELTTIDSALKNSVEERGKLEAERSALARKLEQVERKLPSDQQRCTALLRRVAMLPIGSRSADRIGQSNDAGSYPVQYSADRPYFAQLMGDPAYAQAVTTWVKGEVDKTYGRLFADLNLAPSDLAALEELLVQRVLAREDAAGLLGPGTDSRERSLARAETVQAINDEIRSTFGAQVWQQVHAYDGRYRYYAVLDELRIQLSYTAAPLGTAQYDQFLGLLVNALGERMTTVYWTVPEGVIAQAESVLSPVQIEALQRIQALLSANLKDRNAREHRGINTEPIALPPHEN